MIAGPATALESDLVTFTATFFDPGDDFPQTYQWTVISSNGQVIAPQPATPAAVSAAGVVPAFSFTVADDGLYQVVLTLSDGIGTYTETHALVVGNRPVTGLNVSGPPTGHIGDPVSLAITYSDPGTADTWYGRVAFGDGSQTPLVSGTLSMAPQHVYSTASAAGPYTIVVQVWDDDMRGPDAPGAVAGTDYLEATRAITVFGNPLVGDDLLEAMEDAVQVTLDVLANDQVTAPNHGPLSIVAVGKADHGGLVEVAAGGLSLLYSPACDFHGTEVFTYTVSDADGGLAEGRVTVTVVPVNNDPPTANADTFIVQRDSWDNTLDVLANDSIMPDVGETLTVIATSAPSEGGTLSVANDGTHVRYAPAAGFAGTETFTYTIVDSHGDLAVATATVIVNSPPMASNDAFAILRNSTGNYLDVLKNDAVDTAAGEFASIIAVGPATHGGTVAVSDDGRWLVYAPGPGFEGIERFSYTVSDGRGGTATAIVAVSVSASPAGTLVYAIPSGGGSSGHDLTLRVVGGTLQLVDATGAVVTSVPLASANQVLIFGADNEDDRLTLDFATGGLYAFPAACSSTAEQAATTRWRLSARATVTARTSLPARAATQAYSLWLRGKIN